MAPDAPIGIFDSGVGGLSVLRHIRAQLPHEHLMYFADSGFAPYGAKSEQVVAERVLAIGDFFVEQGAKAIVVACNTATVAAIALLRERYPAMTIVGVEPGLKPAAAASTSNTVGVLATEVTLSGKKFLLLRDQVAQSTGARFLLQPCHGLVDQIELGELDSEATAALLRRYIGPLLEAGADVLVLGCTHYPLVRASIEGVIAASTDRAVTLIDTGEAVARHLARLLAAGGIARPASETPAGLDGYTSAGASALSAAFSGLLGLDPPTQEAVAGAGGGILIRQNK